MAVNRFDAPVPGQALTANPGGAGWQKPPRFTKPDEAAEYTWNNITRPSMAIKIKKALEMGIPAEAITKQLIFSGFKDSKWTPDIAMLIAEPVLSQVVGLGKAAGVQNIKVFKKDTETAKYLAKAEYGSNVDKLREEMFTIYSREPDNVNGPLNNTYPQPEQDVSVDVRGLDTPETTNEDMGSLLRGTPKSMEAPASIRNKPRGLLGN